MLSKIIQTQVAQHQVKRARVMSARVHQWTGMALLALFSIAGQTPLHAADYQIGSDDLLHITVFDHPELTLDTRVSQSGNISFPPVGAVGINGKSTHEVETILARKLSEGGFVRQAQVSVIVSEYQSQKVSVIGQVSKPGQYPLTQSQHILDVLSAAGGPMNDTAADQATLMHKDGSMQTIDLLRLVQGDLSMNVEVHGGDTLSVPRAAQFYIYGEVQHPGVYRLNANMTMSQAISMGGGLTRHGTENRAVVKRRNELGIEQEYRIRSTDVLQPNDVLMIKESLF